MRLREAEKITYRKHRRQWLEKGINEKVTTAGKGYGRDRA